MCKAFTAFTIAPLIPFFPARVVRTLPPIRRPRMMDINRIDGVMECLRQSLQMVRRGASRGSVDLACHDLSSTTIWRVTHEIL
jgi:hypothetical protein